MNISILTIFLCLVLQSTVIGQGTNTYIFGVDLDEIITDPTFYNMMASRIVQYQNEFIAIPYSPGYTDAVYYSSKANFPQIHLKINPSMFTTISPTFLVNDIFQNFKALGLTVTGIWLEVFNENSYWQVSQENNVNIIMNILNSFNHFFSQLGININIGVITTINNWRFVTGTSTLAATSGYLYWSAIGDSMTSCNNLNYAGWKYCFISQVANGPEINGYSFNFNLMNGVYYFQN